MTPVTGPAVRTLLDAVRDGAADHPHETAYIFLREGDREEPLSRADLWRRVVAASKRIRHVTRPDDRVLVAYPPGLDFNVALLATLHAGAVAVPVQPPTGAQRLERIEGIAADCQPAAALGGPMAAAAAAQGPPRLRAVPWLDAAAGDAASGAVVDEADGRPAPSGVALLQYTSGSTGQPKGVVITHDNVMSNIEAIARLFEPTPKDRAVFWLPPYHDMGLIGAILASLVTRVTTTLMAPTTFVRRPLRWLHAISRMQATISGAPNFAYALCAQRATDSDIAALRLSSWQVAFCGAEPIDAAVLRTFSRRFAPSGFDDRALLACYGLAEATLMVTGGRRGHSMRTRILDATALDTEQCAASAASSARTRELVVCGTPTPHHGIAIVHPDSREPLGDGQVGEVWVRGPSVAAGYWNRPDESRKTFQGRIAHWPDDQVFLRTGDLGFLDAGELVVTGRLKDMIIVAGRNLYPDDLELSARGSHAVLADGRHAAFGVDDAIVLVHEVDRRTDKAVLREAGTAITRALFESHGISPHRVVLVPHHAIPLTTSGKVRRSECRRLFIQNELRELRP